jgi:hypothetical protein
MRARKWITGTAMIVAIAGAGVVAPAGTSAPATGTAKATVTLVADLEVRTHEPRYLVRVTAPAGAAAATGTVDITEAGIPLPNCTDLTLSNGYVRCASPLFVARTVRATVTYSGDATYAPARLSDTVEAPVPVSGALSAGLRPRLTLQLKPGYTHLRQVTLRVTSPGIHLLTDAAKLVKLVRLQGLVKATVRAHGGELILSGIGRQRIEVSLASGALIVSRAAEHDRTVGLTMTFVPVNIVPVLTGLVTLRR